MQGLRISGFGHALPSTEISNDYLNPQTSEWVSTRLGINSRRYMSEDQTFLRLIADAAEQALSSAKLKPEAIDGVIVATSSPDYLQPSTAAILHGELGLHRNCMAFDIQAMCAGFIYGMGIAAGLMTNSKNGKWLLIGADQYSKLADQNDRNKVFFGDGAAAMILERQNQQNTSHFEFFSEGKGWASFQTDARERKFKMNTREVYESATTKLPDAIRLACSKVGIEVRDIANFFVHQPSKPVLDQLQSELNVSDEKFHRNLSLRANTAGATIPLLFSETLGNGLQIPNNSWVCFAAIGAGWVWGVGLVQWV